MLWAFIWSNTVLEYLFISKSQSYISKPIFSKHRFFDLKKQHLAGRICGDTDRKGKKTCSGITINAINWLESFSKDCGDSFPDENVVKKFLPACYTKTSVFNTYTEEMKNTKQEHIKLSTFLNIWNKYCGHILISKVIYHTI